HRRPVRHWQLCQPLDALLPCDLLSGDLSSQLLKLRFAGGALTVQVLSSLASCFVDSNAPPRAVLSRDRSQGSSPSSAAPKSIRPASSSARRAPHGSAGKREAKDESR